MTFKVGDTLVWRGDIFPSSKYEVVKADNQDKIKIAFINMNGVLLTQSAVYSHVKLHRLFRKLTKLEQVLK